LGSALPLIAIFLYTKLDLNANSSFKVICRTRYRDGRTEKTATICFPPFGEHNKFDLLCLLLLYTAYYHVDENDLHDFFLMVTSCMRCNIALEDGPPEKDVSMSSPSRTNFVLPMAERNLWVTYTWKHALK